MAEKGLFYPVPIFLIGHLVTSKLESIAVAKTLIISIENTVSAASLFPY